MDRWRGRSRNLAGSYKPSATTTRPPVPSSWHGLSTPRTLCQPNTGLTPFQGIQKTLFLRTGDLSEVSTVKYWFRERERIWDAAHHPLQRAVCRQKGYTEFHSPSLPTQDIRIHLPCKKKLSPRYIGPFSILEQVKSSDIYKLQLPAQYSPHLSCIPPQSTKYRKVRAHREENHNRAGGVKSPDRARMMETYSRALGSADQSRAGKLNTEVKSRMLETKAKRER